jgi:predicted extracellular nuclease
MTERHFVAFWNLENLFDAESASRSEGLARRLREGLKGWSEEVLAAKLDQVAAGIQAMDEGRGPDILGVCEVESRAVLERLAGKLAPRRYGVVHAESPDQRGIDTAFLYDTARYEVARETVFTHFVMRRTYTRDILQATFATRAGRRLVVFANHWPARSGGRWESEPFRMTAGETLAHWHGRVREELGEDIAVLALGDFNDQPFDRSLVDYALATNNRGQVERGREVPRFLNLMWPLAGAAEGSYVFEGQPHLLDQVLAGRSLLSGRGGFRLEGGAAILRPPGVKDAPRPFGRPETRVDRKGYSDHHAVGVALLEA